MESTGFPGRAPMMRFLELGGEGARCFGLQQTSKRKSFLVKAQLEIPGVDYDLGRRTYL